ncbi:hypothetical protein RclHR1_03450004 [Rhizophagus clarus]|nr:hypothetical protein RclHR1_03450004 [Rhizophagus clarus]
MLSISYALKHTLTLPKIKTHFYGVSFNHYDSDNSIFAAVGGRHVIIARFDSNRPVAFNVVQTYEDDDKEEDYYCCTWSINPDNGAPLLAVAGATGIIKIISTSVGLVIKSLTGHGGEINEIKFHPREPFLLFSASKDHSIRLWNLKTMQLVAVFAGERGHCEPVLSIDIHLSGNFLASSGMDHAVKIWTLCTPIIINTIESSFNPRSSSSRSRKSEQKKCCSSDGTPLMPVIVHYPIFTTTQLHNNYVDCVRWYGDLLMSRCAADATIVLWKPDVELVASDNSNITTVVVGGPAATNKQRTSFDIICELEFNHCDIWFLRFGISYDYRILATGNQAGQIYLWKLEDIPFYIDDYIKRKKTESPGKKKEKPAVKKKKGNKKNNELTGALASGSESANTKRPIILNSTVCESIIRQVDFSNDRQWIVAICDDGSIWCWKNVGNNVTDGNNINQQSTTN